jgi:hypothetical protein
MRTRTRMRTGNIRRAHPPTVLRHVRKGLANSPPRRRDQSGLADARSELSFFARAYSVESRRRCRRDGGLRCNSSSVFEKGRLKVGFESCKLVAKISSSVLRRTSPSSPSGRGTVMTTSWDIARGGEGFLKVEGGGAMEPCRELRGDSVRDRG